MGHGRARLARTASWSGNDFDLTGVLFTPRPWPPYLVEQESGPHSRPAAADQDDDLDR
jgi:hypothetical protein